MCGEKRRNMDIETRDSRNTEEERKCIRRGRWVAKKGEVKEEMEENF